MKHKLDWIRFQKSQQFGPSWCKQIESVLNFMGLLKQILQKELFNVQPARIGQKKINLVKKSLIGWSALHLFVIHIQIMLRNFTWIYYLWPHLHLISYYEFFSSTLNHVILQNALRFCFQLSDCAHSFNPRSCGFQ